MQTQNLNLDTEFVAIQDQLLSYLYRLSTSQEDAQDLLHDTYLRVQQKIDQFEGRSSFKTWVFAIATNMARDHQRVLKRWRLEVQDQCKEASLSTPAYQQRILSAFQNQAEQKFELIEHINYCFTCIAKNLKLEQQIAIILREFYHFSRKEIANILDLTESVIKHLLYDGRQELQLRYDHRCALINKEGVCHQCAELNDFLQDTPDSSAKIQSLSISTQLDAESNLENRFALIAPIHPLHAPAAALENTILQILRETIGDE